jgi:hypothetical protein
MTCSKASDFSELTVRLDPDGTSIPESSFALKTLSPSNKSDRLVPDAIERAGPDVDSMKTPLKVASMSPLTSMLTGRASPSPGTNLYEPSSFMDIKPLSRYFQPLLPYPVDKSTFIV